MKTISIGLLGLGTVGSGVINIINQHQDKLIHHVGCPVKIKRILVQDLFKTRVAVVPPNLLTSNPNDILFDEDIDIVVEVMGGIENTRLLLIEALEQGKHVVTANKDLMALYGAELLTIATKNNCDLYYEASVAGGIPIIRTLIDGLGSDRLTKMLGIINGTTNFILTKMSQEGRAYAEVLKEAQKLGFAESDPTADVEGIDAARKMAILATLGFSMKINLDDVSVAGISQISEEDLQYGKQLGYTMKLIGLAKKDGEKVEVSVQPTLLSNHHPLASVHNEYNAIYICGEAVGETMFYGPGAGSLPTANSVVSDIVAVMKNMRLGVNGMSFVTPQYPKTLKEENEKYSKYFLRLNVKDEVGVFAEITSIFALHHVSFEKILQMPIRKNELAEIVLVTHEAAANAFQDIISKLRDLPFIEEIKSSYRVEGSSNT